MNPVARHDDHLTRTNAWSAGNKIQRFVPARARLYSVTFDHPDIAVVNLAQYGKIAAVR
jgi:hypothetical protein